MSSKFNCISGQLKCRASLNMLRWMATTEWGNTLLEFLSFDSETQFETELIIISQNTGFGNTELEWQLRPWFYSFLIPGGRVGDCRMGQNLTSWAFMNTWDKTHIAPAIEGSAMERTTNKYPWMWNQPIAHPLVNIIHQRLLSYKNKCVTCYYNRKKLKFWIVF
jgi:hypothetical protein